MVSRPGWATVAELTIAAIAVPAGSVVSLDELGLQLPTNWNVRPAWPNAQRIGGEFLKAVDQAAREGRLICGVRVPSVISTTDWHVLLDPRQRDWKGVWISRTV